MKAQFKTIHGNEFATPQWLFDSLNAEFNFTRDLAATRENAKCPLYIPKEADSLHLDWSVFKGWLWLNPPYTPLKPWIEKCQIENQKGARIVALVPPFISARYFQKHLPSEIRFILGRVPFVLNGKEMKANTHDSCLLIYDTKIRQPKVSYVERDSLRAKEGA
jgi:phage N-6-adenine-methyltransferase